MEIIFWLSVFMIFFAYFGYPITLKFIRSEHYATNGRFNAPTVSVIIAAANEEEKIAGKLQNTLNTGYDNVQDIIVALDAPTDGTEEIVDKWMFKSNNLVKKVVLPEKGGKETALKAAIDASTSDIIIVTDTATDLGYHTIQRLVRHFFDDRVGAVDGMSKIRGEESSEGLYLRFDNKIREMHSSRGGLVGMGGCLFAVRSEIVKAPGGFATDLQSDFRTAIVTKRAGFQTKLDREAVALFDDIADKSKEFNRKVRTTVRALNVFFHSLDMLNPRKYGVFAYQFFCHKLMKWLVPFFMIIALISNIILTDIHYGTLTGSFWSALQVLQGLFYLCAIVGHKYPDRFPKFRIPAFFLMANAAILKAWFEYAKGERYVTWTPSKR